MTKRFSIGDRVVKNPATWVANDFDTWGRGVGVGLVVEPPFPMLEHEVDVRWPHGRCFELVAQLLPAPVAATGTAESAGIDLLIGSNVAHGRLVAAISRHADIPADAIVRETDPGFDFADLVAGRDAWATIHDYSSGDFSCKVAIDACHRRELGMVAARIAADLGVGIAWPDESTLAAEALILCLPDGQQLAAAADDAEPDGFFIRALSNDPPCVVLHVSLLNEGGPVWRPAIAQHRGGWTFRLLTDPDPAALEETWELLPGTEVTFLPRRDSDGRIFVAATSLRRS